MLLQNKTLIKIIKYLVNLFKFINKHLFILSIFSILNSIYAKFRENKFYKTINLSIKFIFIITLIVSTGFILYFTDFTNPINTTFSIYLDLINPYIDFIKTLWYDLKILYHNLLNISVEDSIASTIKESTDIKNQLKDGIKEGVKEGFKEAVDELINEINMENKDKSDLLKQSALFTSLLFLGYFLFILPGSSISPEALTEYNWFNQSLIEFKISVKDLILYYFSKPGNPGNSGTPGNSVVVNSPISPAGLDTYFPQKLSVINSVSSDGISTVTPNTPKVTTNLITEVGTQTTLDGFTVSKMVETVDILKVSLNESETNLITESVNKSIKKITD